MFRIETHWLTYTSLHWLSDIEDLHKKQKVDTLTDQIPRHSVRVQLSNNLSVRQDQWQNRCTHLNF